MITGETFPLGVICNIYCPWCTLSAPMAPSRLWLLCVRCGFWTSRYEADRRKVPACSFTSSWLPGCLVGCAAQESCLRSGGLCIMEQSISIVHTHRHTRTNSLHFLDRKFRLYTTTKDTALPCLRSEVKRVLFRRPWVCVCVCARVSPTLAQNADICRSGCTDWVKNLFESV